MIRKNPKVVYVSPQQLRRQREQRERRKKKDPEPALSPEMDLARAWRISK